MHFPVNEARIKPVKTSRIFWGTKTYRKTDTCPLGLSSGKEPTDFFSHELQFLLSLTPRQHVLLPLVNVKSLK